MKSTFGRLFSITALIILLAVILMGISFWGLMRGYLADERQEVLTSNAAAVADLASDYADAYSLGLYPSYLNPELNLAMNLAFSAKVSATDSMLCSSEGEVLLCSCQEPVCHHVGRHLPPDYVAAILEQGGDCRTTVFSDIYPQERCYAAQPFYLRSGNIAGIVIVSQEIHSADDILAQITDIFALLSIVMMLITVIILSVFTRSQISPLKTVSEAARQFGHGNLEARVKLDSSAPEEISDVAAAFNNMAASIEQGEYQRQEFVANVSHELKTPMTTIGGYVDGILDGTIPPEKETHYLTIVSDEVKRLSRLVRSMLDISKLQDQQIPKDKMTRFDVAECMGQVLITYEKKINDKGLDVQVDFPEYPVYAQAVLDSITQVIYNLIDNAVKFCPQGGQLGLKIRESGTKVYVSVSNTGATIPPEELPLVFDRFHKIDKSRSLNREGWGLGLYIVKTIVCSHGEDISVTSRDGKTEFTFTLAEVNSL